MSSRYTPAMLADLIGVPIAQVRAWQRRGWLVPVEETHRLAQFDFTELTVARQLAELHRAGATSRLLAKKLAEINRRFPDVARPLAELSLVLDGKKLLVRRAGGLVEPGGQLRLDFDGVAEPGQEEPRPTIPASGLFLARSTPQLGDRAAPDQLAQWAADFEESGDLAAAAEYYRAALAAGGPQPVLCFHLAEVLYRAGDLPAARERYFMALELDEDYLEARANLGCVLLELGQTDLAAAAFQGALELHEAYSDVHYHLARLFDELGRADDAVRHWNRFVELAPDSPWADEARERLAAKP